MSMLVGTVSRMGNWHGLMSTGARVDHCAPILNCHTLRVRAGRGELCVSEPCFLFAGRVPGVRT